MDSLSFRNVVVIFVICHRVVFGDSNGGANGFAPAQIRPKPIWNATYTDSLKQDLLLNYDKFARPTQHYNVTTVNIGLSILHVEINEFKSTVSVNSWVRLSWTDDKLKWNASHYGGLSDVNFADHEIWQPDVMLYNSASGSAVSHLGGTHCVVKSSGEIVWVPPTQLVALCDLNLRYWPFDTQICYLKFGSWTYDGSEIDIKIADGAIDLSYVIANGEWDITDSNVTRSVKYYSCCDEPYVDVEFKLTLTRRSPAYKAIIIAPAVVIIMLTLMGFWLPPQAGEKVLLNGCTSIIISIFMVYFTQKIPAMGSHTPLIVLFYSSSLYVVCFSMLISVAVIWLSRTQHTRLLPWVIKKPLTGTLGRVLGLQHYVKENPLHSQRVTTEEMRDHQVTDFEEHQTRDDHQIIGTGRKVPLQHDWILFAAAIDRISFIFYACLFGILAAVYSV
ncbi:hypothetical protein PPYR_07473 [Photinus pyralis]|uniref:Neurotransmitter-gated ion-channel ligand-binding domain-containing protein n=2 Tax=Photinus pyralis TaxID=7054 RepID=A0A5N4AQQ0_PHOPY|nr:acetylcholine receptor subunit alpha-type acr-16-like isoform X2 [Photinus pyralis]KAB0799593.1 hypothetical protein PPYR_07473 [Photinus pyralis]